MAGKYLFGDFKTNAKENFYKNEFVTVHFSYNIKKRLGDMKYPPPFKQLQLKLMSHTRFSKTEIQYGRPVVTQDSVDTFSPKKCFNRNYRFIHDNVNILYIVASAENYAFHEILHCSPTVTIFPA